MERSRNSKDSVAAYAVQCGKCFKWRLIPNKEEYETIRERFTEDPWYCDKKPDVSCDDPGDIEYDTSKLWVIDKPNIPKAPPTTERMLSMRRDLSKMDTHYIMPNGKRVRSTVEVQRFLEANPEYKDKLPLASFIFTPPKVTDEMVPRNSAGKGSASSNKKIKLSREADD